MKLFSEQSMRLKVNLGKGNVQAGNHYFINYDKVIPYTNALVERIQSKMKESLNVNEQLELSFSVHFDLVSIHPF